jgi:hypothetical protein
MRKAYNDFGILAEDNVFYGISLGYDFTAEHEWGIKGISRMFGIPELTRKNIGIKSRTITTKKAKDVLVFGVDQDFTFLFSDLWHVPINKRYFLNTKESKKIITEIPYDLKSYKTDLKEIFNKRYSLKIKDEDISKNNIITAWSGEDFGIVVKGKRESKWLHELYQAFINRNIVFTYINLSGTNPFSNSSLSIIIADRLSKNILDAMKNVDKKQLDLKKIEKKINLKERLRESKKFKEFSLSCSPEFIDYDASKKELKELKKKENTKYNVKFWINSSEYYGWNTVEELEELINNKDFTVIEFKKQMDEKKNI